MFRNYFITALRNFRRNKTFSAINVLGLSIGISAAIVIFLTTYYEFSYDRFETDKDRIYRVVLNAKFNGVDEYSAAVPSPVSSAVQNEVTGVELNVPRFQFQGDGTADVSVAGKSNEKPVIFKHQPDVVFTSPQYFSLLSYNWLAGSPETALQEPFGVVLTESRAKQYFGLLPVKDIVGKQLTYNGNITATVTGVVKDLNRNSSVAAGELISFSTIAKTSLQDDFMMTVWNDWMGYTQLYLRLAKGTSPQMVEKQLKSILARYNKDAKGMAGTMSLHLQPLSDVHFDSSYAGVGQRLANKQTLYSMLAIAIFLLLLACINFINLTTANAVQRAKEIGIRKTMGSSRRQLVLQFLGETFFITLIAAFISLLFTPVLLRLFADFIPPGITFSPLQQPSIVLFLVCLMVLVSFLSGLYPALILSGYKPISVLKRQSANTSETRHAWVRKTLTVSQFVIAQFFVIATLMVSKQLNYSINSDLGFRKDAILTFDIPHDTVAAHTQQLLNSINMIPEVQLASTGFMSPASTGMAFTNILYALKPDIKANIQIRWGDPDYINIYGIKLLAGRNVAPSDTAREFLINDTYAKLLGFQRPEEAVGKSLLYDGKSLPVVGVMQDFHDMSTHFGISPMVFSGRKGSTFHIRLQPSTDAGSVWAGAIQKIQKEYKKLYPEEDFHYRFFDDTFAEMYQNERNTSRLLEWSAGLTIFISCLGLLGLVMYTINNRTKEIGIRKVLGASINSIISILSKEFVQLVLIAFLIAAPLAWWAIYKWLEDFTYRTKMSWWIFLVSGSFMLVIALVTLSIQTIRAAISNPVKALRTE